MTEYFNNGIIQLYQSDARNLPIPDNSVDCVVTSPPYWGLRDYGTASWEGGDESCDHLGIPYRTRTGFNKRWSGKEFASNKQGSLREPYKGSCGKCGAVRKDQQLGLEETPEEWVTNLVAVFREVWRVLKPTGTVWLNLGDSYAHPATKPHSKMRLGMEHASSAWSLREQATMGSLASGLKPKDLVGQPWRVAFALQADGWYLRSDIIWSKPNPMPESVTDRPTKAHEYVFLLTKSPRYYYDADAIREVAQNWGTRDRTNGKYHNEGTGLQPHSGLTNSNNAESGRNKRTVWEIPTQPYPEAHFATYPEKLVEPCILAGCPQDGVVLDPFVGSGTTLAVAQRLGRKGIGTDISTEYLQLAEKRISGIPIPMML
jgi:DNA modification methylase